MKILFCSSEVAPYAKTGGLADVSAALPLALADMKQQVKIVMPRYRQVDIKRFKLRKIKGDIYKGNLSNLVDVYFVDNRRFFGREGIYGTKQGDYKDNLERFSFFSRRAIELMKDINFKADIVHCNDWQTAAIIIYLKNVYQNDPFFKGTKTLFTIHNIGYQGEFCICKFSKLGIPYSRFSVGKIKHHKKINLLKGGIVFSDMINTVSPTYAREIQTEKLGFGLGEILRRRKGSLFGVLNGLDYKIWNPSTDTEIVRRYSLADIEKKYENKKYLIESCGLRIGMNAPLFGMVSRIARQKGIDILVSALREALRWDLGVVMLGEGEVRYYRILKSLVKKYPGRFSLNLRFDESLAHNIYAGSDIFLMPSRYEPCGLSQMISLKYGTIPVVFRTGGLSDTVSQRNGFIFNSYSVKSLLNAMHKAYTAYKNKAVWMKFIKEAMTYDFSWRRSAEEYIRLYRRIARR